MCSICGRTIAGVRPTLGICWVHSRNGRHMPFTLQKVNKRNELGNKRTHQTVLQFYMQQTLHTPLHRITCALKHVSCKKPMQVLFEYDRKINILQSQASRAPYSFVVVPIVFSRVLAL